jgi:DinB superfamily
MGEKLPEPWLRGPNVSIHPIARPLTYSLIQVREDLVTWTDGLTTDELWARPMGLGSIGFHIRHIGGSADRLTTYIEGHQLSEQQMVELRAEMDPGASREQLLDQLEQRLLRCESVVEALDPRTWEDAREVGRKRLPTTVGGLVTHISEHSQRHVGEAIVTAKVVKALRGGPPE